LLAAPAAPLARSGDLLWQRAARRGTVLRALDIQGKMGYGRASGVSGRQGLETARTGKAGGGGAKIAFDFPILPGAGPHPLIF
jgi:hypothetical protein